MNDDLPISSAISNYCGAAHALSLRFREKSEHSPIDNLTCANASDMISVRIQMMLDPLKGVDGVHRLELKRTFKMDVSRSLSSKSKGAPPKEVSSTITPRQINVFYGDGVPCAIILNETEDSFQALFHVNRYISTRVHQFIYSKYDNLRREYLSKVSPHSSVSSTARHSFDFGNPMLDAVQSIGQALRREDNWEEVVQTRWDHGPWLEWGKSYGKGHLWKLFHGEPKDLARADESITYSKMVSFLLQDFSSKNLLEFMVKGGVLSLQEYSKYSSQSQLAEAFFGDGGVMQCLRQPGYSLLVNFLSKVIPEMFQTLSQNTKKDRKVPTVRRSTLPEAPPLAFEETDFGDPICLKVSNARLSGFFFQKNTQHCLHRGF